LSLPLQLAFHVFHLIMNETEKESVCVCVCEREREERVCVFHVASCLKHRAFEGEFLLKEENVSEREREREREKVENFTVDSLFKASFRTSA